MKAYVILLINLFTVILCGKPCIDFQDSYVWGPYVSLCDRPDFIASFEGKNSSVIVLTEANVYKVHEKRQQGYEKVMAYLFEPQIKPGGVHDYIEKNIGQFDLIFTFEEHLLSHYPNKCKFVHAVAPCYIKEIKIQEKSKLCSMICGVTDHFTDGHQLRKQVVLRYKNWLDSCKTDETPRTQWKDEFIKDFCFSIVIESTKKDYYFTEKILDCFRVGTIPIYWGCPTIAKFFDSDGIVVFNSLEELEEILKNLTFEAYEKRRSAIERNFELVKQYPSITSRENDNEPCAIDAIWPYCKNILESL